MKIDIDFDELLNDSLNAAIDATIKSTDNNRDADALNRQLQIIATVSAKTTVSILRNYHTALEEALTSFLDTTPTSH